VGGDIYLEDDEVVLLQLSSLDVNLEIPEGQGTILNDDIGLVVGDVVPDIEEESIPLFGTAPFAFPVSLVYPVAVPFTVDFETSDGNELQELSLATTPDVNFTLSYEGVPSASIGPSATAVEVQQALQVITALAGNVQVSGTSIDQAPVQIEFLNGLSGVDAFPLLSSVPNFSVSTLSEPASSLEGDYDVTTGTLSFQPGGPQVQDAVVMVHDDSILEPEPETFRVSLLPSSILKQGVTDLNAWINDPGVGTIIDNEVPPDEYRLWFDGVDYRLDWTAPDGSTENLHKETDGTLPISVIGDRQEVAAANVVTDDKLIIDFINGNPIPNDTTNPLVGMEFFAGSNVSADQIEFRLPPGGALPNFDAVSYVISGIGDGTISLDTAIDSYLVNFTGKRFTTRRPPRVVVFRLMPSTPLTTKYRLATARDLTSLRWIPATGTRCWKGSGPRRLVCTPLPIRRRHSTSMPDRATTSSRLARWTRV